MSWPLMRAEIEERSTSDAATAGSVADAAAAASAGAAEVAAEVAAEACSTGAGAAIASLAVSGVVVAAATAESSFLLPPPQPHRDSDLEDETPPSTIGAAAAYRVRNGDEAVVSLPLVLRSEVPNWRPWLSCRLERFCANRFVCACLQAPGEGRERAIPLLGSIATGFLSV